MIAFIAILLFAFFDYIGFNLIKNRIVYRVIQHLVQVGITYLLWHFFGWNEAVGFLWLWWFWVADLVYYLFYDTLKWYGGDYAGKAFDLEVLDIDSDGMEVVWAWWTPVGLYRVVQGKINQPISGKILLVQAFIGLIFWGIYGT